MYRILLGIIALAFGSLACASAVTTGAARGEDAVGGALVAPTTTPTPTVAAGMVYPICGDWNIRKGASDAGPSLGWLYDGDVAYVFAIRDGWAQVGEGQWVNARALCAK